MTTFGLIWANLFRKRTRTMLTMLSLAVAFLLFVMLRAVAAVFAGGSSIAGVDRLVISPKFSVIDDLPYSQKQQILATPGVEAVALAHWFGGVYQDPKNFFPKYPVEPVEYFDMFPEYQIDAEALDRFARTRTGAVTSEVLAAEYGWSVGDVIPIQADIWPRDDGTRLWEFELVGLYTSEQGQGGGPGGSVFLFNYDYFTEAVVEWGKDRVGWWTARLSASDRAAEIASEIDQLFENSADPTRTATEDEFNRQFAAQLGDMGFITTMIMSAVFFTIVLLTANTMTQALRERVPELAVLKTLGFTNTKVAAFVLLEAVFLCLVGGALGIGLGLALEPAINDSPVGTMLGVFEIPWSTVAAGFALALGIGLVVGSVPALAARRLTIVEALRAGAK